MAGRVTEYCPSVCLSVSFGFTTSERKLVETSTVMEMFSLARAADISIFGQRSKVEVIRAVEFSNHLR